MLMSVIIREGIQVVKQIPCGRQHIYQPQYALDMSSWLKHSSKLICHLQQASFLTIHSHTTRQVAGAITSSLSWHDRVQKVLELSSLKPHLLSRFDCSGKVRSLGNGSLGYSRHRSVLGRVAAGQRCSRVVARLLRLRSVYKTRLVLSGAKYRSLSELHGSLLNCSFCSAVQSSIQHFQPWAWPCFGNLGQILWHNIRGRTSTSILFQLCGGLPSVPTSVCQSAGLRVQAKR